MTLEDFVEIVRQDKPKNDVSLVGEVTLSYEATVMPEGYQKLKRWLFSDGTVIDFDDNTDTETSWKGHDRKWTFRIKGNAASEDADNSITSKRGNV
jgi:hypothetical protein